MKSSLRLALLGAALLLAFVPAAPALAQNLNAYQVTTLQSAATATGNGTSLDTMPMAAVSVQITGTFVGTVTFEGTMDGSNWIALEATNANDDTRATTATAPGIYSVVLHGSIRFRARVSAYTSGSITVKARLGPGMITRNAGSGGASVGGSDKQVQVNAGGSLAGAAGFEYQSGASPNVKVTAQNDAHVALEVAPFSDNYTAVPFKLSPPPGGGATLNFDPTYNAGKAFHLQLDGSSFDEYPSFGVVGIDTGDAAGGANFGLTLGGPKYFNLDAVGSGYDSSSLANIPLSGLMRTGPSMTGGMIFYTHAAAPIIFATGGYALTNERLRILSTGAFQYPATNTTAGTTGAQTINKVSGTVNFAAGASSLIVANSLVTANSLVFCVIRTNDSTALIKNVVPAAGSFTIRLNAAATAETSVGFFVINQ